MRQWTALRETYGIRTQSAHPVARLLVAQPDLRGLIPEELAQRLQISLDDAQKGILALGAECFPPSVFVARQGESFDSLTILAGHPANPVRLVGHEEESRTEAMGMPLRNVFRGVF